MPTERIGQRLFTVEEYDRMVEAGILSQNDRVELVRGVVREMSPKTPPHVIAVKAAFELFLERLRGRASVFFEAPAILGLPDSKPEPDVIVCSHPDFRTYGTRASHPVFVVEVAQTSLRYDLSTKAEVYAEAGVQEYWVVDLVHEALEVFRDPRDGRYQTRQTYRPGSGVTLFSWPDVEIDVAALFPKPIEG